VLLAATVVYSAFTLLTALAASLPQLQAIRFLAGLGLGAIMPMRRRWWGSTARAGAGSRP
jgi:MFS family permease